MAFFAIKSWVDGEQLLASDLNAEYNNIYANALNAASQSDVDTGTLSTVALTPASNLIALRTAQNSTSGTAITFSSVPSGVRKIHVMVSGGSTSGTSNVMIQIGDAGGVETSAYLGAATTITSATPATANFTTGFGVTATTIVGMTIHGTATLTLMDSSTNTWSCTSLMGHSNATTFSMGAGVKSTSAILDRVVITTVGGADTFDAGSINISYER